MNKKRYTFKGDCYAECRGGYKVSGDFERDGPYGRASFWTDKVTGNKYGHIFYDSQCRLEVPYTPGMEGKLRRELDQLKILIKKSRWMGSYKLEIEEIERIYISLNSIRFICGD